MLALEPGETNLGMVIHSFDEWAIWQYMLQGTSTLHHSPSLFLLSGFSSFVPITFMETTMKRQGQAPPRLAIPFFLISKGEAEVGRIKSSLGSKPSIRQTSAITTPPFFVFFSPPESW